MNNYYALLAHFKGDGRKQQDRAEIVTKYIIPEEKSVWAFGVSLADAILERPLIKWFVHHEGQPYERAMDGENYLGLYPLRIKETWTEEPIPWIELKSPDWNWKDGNVNPEIFCALLEQSEANVEPIPSRPLSYWGEPEGMATLSLSLIESLSDLPGDAHNYYALEHITHVLPDASESQRHTAARLLAAELCAALGAWNAGELTAGQACAEHDGMLALDAAFLKLIASLGARGQQLAAELAASCRGCRSKHGESWQGWRLWLHLGPPNSVERARGLWRTPFMIPLADALWAARTQEQFERELELEGAAPLSARLRVVEQDGARYSQISKAGGAVSWALGGAGERIESSEQSASVEGHGLVPALAYWLPHGRSRTTSGRPADVQLGVGFDEVGLVLPGNRQLVLTPTESKVLILMLATSREPQGVSVNLGDLTRHLNPKKGRIQARDYEETARALEIIAAARLRLPDGTNIRMFDARVVTLDGGAYEKRTVSWVASPHFYRLQRGQLQGAEGVSALNGAFLANLDLIFSFSGNDAAELRAYIYACKLWNDARHKGAFDAGQIRKHTLEEWAAATNMLSPAALDYLDGNKEGSGRVQLSKDKTKAWETLTKLVERGVLTIEGDKRSFRLIPTQAHVRALEKHREGRASTLGFLGLGA